MKKKIRQKIRIFELLPSEYSEIRIVKKTEFLQTLVVTSNWTKKFGSSVFSWSNSLKGPRGPSARGQRQRVREEDQRSHRKDFHFACQQLLRRR